MIESLTRGVLSARCFCGLVTLRSESGAKNVIHCHCGQCRRLSGAAFTTWVSVGRQDVQVDGAENLTAFMATVNVTRRFCKACGSHIYTTDERYPEILGIPAGIVDGEALPQPKAHYFASHRAAWFSIADALPQYGGDSGYEPIAN